LSPDDAASTGAVVSFDLEEVGVNLESVPIDEVLSYRKENLETHSAYRRMVRKFVRELSLFPEEERKEALRDRKEEIKAHANDLKKVAEKAWRRPATWTLALTGAALTPVFPVAAGAVAAGATILGLYLPSEAPTDAYSFLFGARRLGR
jgi:hypothetical protein